MAVSGDDVQHSSDTDAFLAEVNAKDVVCNILQFFGFPLGGCKEVWRSGIQLLPYMKRCMHRKATAT